MKHAVMLMLFASLAVATASCQPEKTTPKESSGQAMTASAAMGATAGHARPTDTMDFSLPPGDPATARPMGARPQAPAAPPSASPPGALKAALADLDRIKARQNQVTKLWLTINTVSDAKKNGKALLKGSLDVLALTIASMRKAVTLSTADLKTFVARQKAHRALSRKLNESIQAKQRTLKGLPGGQAFFDSLKQSATVEVQKHSQTLMQLGRQLLARQRELKP